MTSLTMSCITMLLVLVSSISCQRRGPPGKSFSTGSVRPPPPVLFETAGGTANREPARDSNFVWDDDCKDDRPPFGLGRWIQVNRRNCPVAFDDPYFEETVGCESEYFSDCRDKVHPLWTYPEYGFCRKTVAYIYCPALLNCGPRG